MEKLEVELLLLLSSQAESPTAAVQSAIPTTSGVSGMMENIITIAVVVVVGIVVLNLLFWNKNKKAFNNAKQQKIAERQAQRDQAEEYRRK
jgi:cbb3-type cytochrome oxidase subunit 3